MTVAADRDSPSGAKPDAYFDGSPAETVLVGIGEELRGAYREVTGADQPAHLVDLAQKLDSLIMGGDRR